MVKNPHEFYDQQVHLNKNNLSRMKKRLLAFGMVRLLLFLLIVLLVYLFRSQTNVALLISFAGLALFLFLVARNTDLKKQKHFTEELIHLNELELKSLNKEKVDVPSGKEYVEDNHHYNQDIDLFGEGSIFQYINRTKTTNGEKYLAETLNSNHIQSIAEKQAAIQELSQQPLWRQTFQTTAALIQSKIENTVLLKWLDNYQLTIPKPFGYLPLLFTATSVLLAILYGVGYVKGALLLVWFFAGLGISAIYFGRVNKLYQSAGKMTETFSQYAKLLQKIEQMEFEAGWLVAQKNKIKTNEKKASQILTQLSKELNSLDQRNNILFALVGNGFLLWDLRYAFRIEKWMKNYRKTVSNWFQAIEFFDTYNSLANYAFNHPQHIYPTNSEATTTIEATNLGHPLLNKEKRVTNNVLINQHDFLIITGANMAGKSTFLRTVALNLVLANVGLPVCASSFSYTPIKLISSMRTTDSLQNDESYFFSELKRLKFIIDELKKDTYFIILDEILKGTNSKDKEEGSKKFVKKLIGTHSTGMIATHDLSLCQLAETNQQIKNHYFDAEIVNDELYFDYRFKDGVCKNMNASFLLRKMEIV